MVAIRTAQKLVEGAGLTENAAKFVRFFKTAATVLSFLGIALDGIILIYEVIEGDRQRTELQKFAIPKLFFCSSLVSCSQLIWTSAIQSLYCRRFQAIQLQDYIKGAEYYHAEIANYLKTYTILKQSNTNQKTIDAIMSDLVTTIVDGTKKVSLNPQSMREGMRV